MKTQPCPGRHAIGALALAAVLGGCAVAPVAPIATIGENAAPTPDVIPPPFDTRPDERRAEQPFTVQLFDRPTALRLGYELTLERRGNFDLNAARDRDRRVRDQELKFEARMRASEQVTLLAEGVLVSEVRRQKATGTIQRTEGAQRGQLWLLVDRIGGTPLSLQAGRIALVDRRAWWWDDDLDAVRLMARGDTWRFESGLGRELARKASNDDGIELKHRGVIRWWGQGAWTWQPRHTLEAFWLKAVDRSGTPVPGSLWRAGDVDPIDARLLWLGLRASGQVRTARGSRWSYWADVARVSGRQTSTLFGDAVAAGTPAGSSSSQRVRGHALDLGTQWTWDLPLRPVATLAWAQGSGSAPSAAIDRNFRQTGLHENKARIGGVKRLHRYGELLDPELANLRVGTVGLGARLGENTSLELLWHRYRQVVASPVLAGSRVSQSPTGLSPDIGHEVDLFLAWRESRQVELTLALSRFVPGAAFQAERRDPAHGIELGLALSF
jgi:alginate production protein